VYISSLHQKKIEQGRMIAEVQLQDRQGNEKTAKQKQNLIHEPVKPTRSPLKHHSSQPISK
jgi:hypothetical protein